jgi:hemerythrin-like domain-containing protein
MLRDPSLIPLSHHHQHGLALCVMTDRSLAQDSSPENIARFAQKALAVYDLELINHFEIEEQILFPAIDSPLTLDLLADHRKLESLIAQLRAAPSAELLHEFTALLRAHIRKEENELFEDIQQRLARETLDVLGKEIDDKAVRICL